MRSTREPASPRDERAADVNAALATGAVPVASIAAPPRRPAGFREQPEREPAQPLASRGLGSQPTTALFQPDDDDGGVSELPGGPAEASDYVDRPEPVEAPGGRRRARDFKAARAGRATAPTVTGSAAADGKKPKRGRRRKSNFWRELPVLVVVALLLTFLIQTFVARVYEIPSGSMETTLHGCHDCNNDRVLVDKLSYRFGNPSPGDVVVFVGPPGWQSDGDPVERSDNPIIRGLQNAASLIGLAPPQEEDFIKRVIATGGQTVACCDAQNRVMVDGKSLNEPYIYYTDMVAPKSQEQFGPVVVPQGELWMMGDSRNNSKDSRWPGQGPVPITDVVGKARFVVLPLSRIKGIPAPNPQEVSLSAGTGPTGPSLALGFLGAVPITIGGRQLRLRRGRRGSAARHGGSGGPERTS